MRGPGARRRRAPARAGPGGPYRPQPSRPRSKAPPAPCPIGFPAHDCRSSAGIREPRPMVKPAKSQFVCQNCGAAASRWAGKCAACGAWNTLSEEADVTAPPGSGMARASKGRAVALETLVSGAPQIARIPTGLAELDRVTGGGVVPGSALLIGGGAGHAQTAPAPPAVPPLAE